MHAKAYDTPLWIFLSFFFSVTKIVYVCVCVCIYTNTNDFYQYLY